VTHRQLSFKLAYCFKDYTNYDEKCGTAERNYAEKAAGYCIDNKRYASNETKEESSHKDYFVEHLFDILCSRLTGADTGDKAALLHEVVGNLYRVEGNGNVEVRESDDKNEEESDVNSAVGIKYVLEAVPESTLRKFFASDAFYEVHNRGEEGNDRACKYDGHNAGHIELDRKCGVLTAVHLATNNSFCILNLDLSFSIGHIGYEDKRTYNDEKRTDTEDPFKPSCNVFCCVESIDEGNCDTGNTAYDVREEYHRDTVTNALLVYFFAEPHNKRGACCEACNHNDGFEYHVGTAGSYETSVLEHEEVTDGSYYRKHNRKDTCELFDFSSAVLAVLGPFLKFRNSNGEKLDNDLRVNVRCYRKREEFCLCKSIAGEDVDDSEYALCHLGSCFCNCNVLIVNEWCGDYCTYAV